MGQITACWNKVRRTQQEGADGARTQTSGAQSTVGIRVPKGRLKQAMGPREWWPGVGPKSLQFTHEFPGSADGALWDPALRTTDAEEREQEECLGETQEQRPWSPQLPGLRGSSRVSRKDV